MVHETTSPNSYSDVPRVPDLEHVDLESLVSSPSGPLELEIGFGKGRFLLDRAAAHPGHRFLGLETKRKSVHLVNERVTNRNLKNVAVLHGDARSVLRRVINDGAVARIFIHFPDPWWKARHEKRMVVCPELTREVARLLEDGGELFVQTDVDFRAERYLETIARTPGLVPVEGDGVVDSNPYKARSLREIRCEDTGLPIFRLLFVRRPRS